MEQHRDNEGSDEPYEDNGSESLKPGERLEAGLGACLIGAGLFGAGMGLYWGVSKMGEFFDNLLEEVYRFYFRPF